MDCSSPISSISAQRQTPKRDDAELSPEEGSQLATAAYTNRLEDVPRKGGMVLHSSYIYVIITIDHSNHVRVGPNMLSHVDVGFRVDNYSSVTSHSTTQHACYRITRCTAQ